MRAFALFAASSALVAGVLADFHILTANCIEKEFSKRSLSRFDVVPDGHALDAAEFEKRHESDASDLVERGKGGVDKPATWHVSDRRQTVNLMPSNQYGCHYLQNNEHVSLTNLPGDYFQTTNFCGKNLDFYKIDGDRWEVWEHNANPGIKYGECYYDLSEFECDLWTGFFQEHCNWRRRYVCAIPVC